MEAQNTASNPGSEKYLHLSNLKRVRQLKGLSTRELSVKTDIDQSMISKLENQRRGAHGRTLRKLAEALGVETDELVG